MTERRHSTCSVIINVKDVNDNTPKFVSRMQINLAEDEQVGYPVMLVAATDADKNDSIRYTITAGDPGRKFHLNRDTGLSYFPYFTFCSPLSVVHFLYSTSCGLLPVVYLL